VDGLNRHHFYFMGFGYKPEVHGYVVFFYFELHAHKLASA
jgi:hypothetical protein